MEHEVESKIFIGKELRMNDNDKEFAYIPDHKGYLSRISVTAKVPDASKVQTTFEADKDGGATIKIDDNTNVRDDLICEFQELESLLGFTSKGAFRRVRWETQTIEYVPENEEEQKRLVVTKLTYSETHEVPEVEITENIFKEEIATRKRYSSLRVLQAFHREGTNEMIDQRYINSFFNYYFVIEALYSGGKTKGHDVINNFLSNDELKEIVNSFIKDAKIGSKHMERLQELLKQEKSEYTTEGLIKLLFQMRGNLHHYFQESTKPQGSPFTQKEYWSLALLAQYVATVAIGYQIAKINRSYANE